MNQHMEVDLLVLGAGAAGMTTALVAAYEGCEVLVAEKTDKVGGTAATSAGTIWIPGNTQSIEAGHPDTAAAATEYLDTLIAAPDSEGLRRAFLATGDEAIEYLRKRSDVQFAPSGMHPDYRPLRGAARSGRTLAPLTFDGRLLGADFERVRPPIPEFMVLGGMMAGKADIPRLLGRFKSIGDFVYSGRLFARYLGDRLRYSRGTRVVMGNALVARLFFSLRKAGVPILFKTSPVDLIQEGNRIVGARLRSPDGVVTVTARRGVVLATGGFGHNDAMRRELMPRPTPPYSMACEGNTGDGIQLGLHHGGTVPKTRGDAAFWTPISLTTRPDGSKGIYPHLSLDRAKPGLIAVNSAAKRFVNEADSYHDFVAGMYRSHRSVPTLPAYLICEADFVRRFGLGDIHPGTKDLRPYEEAGYIITAPSMDALASKLGLPADVLRTTIARHNEFAHEGHDADFGKGSSELNRFNGDPSQLPNPCLREIANAPFVGIEVWPAEIGTSSGLQTDADGQVIAELGRPIAGLYACGNDMNSVMAGTYPGPGTTLGPALVFGYRVALHASSKASREWISPPPMVRRVLA
jgi:succinate dehydrogenase/fumarate reductase flavoprotein subunit